MIAIPAPGTEVLLDQAGFREAGIPIAAPPRVNRRGCGPARARDGVLDQGSAESLSPLYLRPPDAVLKSSPR